MALLSRERFAEYCSIANNTITIQLNRKKIFQEPDGLFDTENPVNKLFVDRRAQTVQKKGSGPVEPTEQKETEVKKVKIKEAPPTTGDVYRQEQELNELEIKERQLKIEALQIKNDKANAALLPTDNVKELIAQLSKSMMVEFNNSVDKMLLKISKKKKLSNEENSELRKELRDEINDAVDKAVDECKKDLKSLMENISEQRGKGERK